jgi:hypothetical protein
LPDLYLLFPGLAVAGWAGILSFTLFPLDTLDMDESDVVPSGTDAPCAEPEDEFAF